MPTAVALTRSMAVVAMLTVGLGLREPAAGQDRMELGPRQFEADTSGAGAVLCTWSVYLSVQGATAVCATPRKPVDDAIDMAILAIDDFIIANSSLRPTRAMIEEFKRRAAETQLRLIRQDGLREFCETQGFDVYRHSTPAQVETAVKRLLAIPREPVLNPCL
jgi:hypothetical protein